MSRSESISASRSHHLIKTFLCSHGWRDQQRPDGTLVLRTPTGHTYTTQAHGAALFPALGQSTGQLHLPTDLIAPQTDRIAMIPRRKKTREQDHRARITAERRERRERRERTEIIAEQQRQHQAWIAANYQPPPF